VPAWSEGMAATGLPIGPMTSCAMCSPTADPPRPVSRSTCALVAPWSEAIQGGAIG
jgi:hypothetical protein